MVPRMWTESSFRWNSELIQVPERDVVPKPLQRPHPPLWQTSTSPESFRMAGSLGVGVLATTLLTPLHSLRALLDEYRQGLEHCRPAGQCINARTAVFTFMHCANTRQEAIDSRAGEAALWFVNAAPKVFQAPRELWISAIRGDFMDGTPGAAASVDTAEDHRDIDLDDPVPVIRLLNRQLVGEELDPVEVYDVLESIDSVIIGDVETCRRKVSRFAETGVDRLMCLMQMGALPHELVMRSIELAGKHLLGED